VRQFPETIRLYDVRGWRDPRDAEKSFVTASDALNNPPFVLLGSWTDLPKVYAQYSDTPGATAGIEQMRQKAVAWWKAFKTKQQMQVKELIERSFARTEGSKLDID
jgi:hypothetical protein